MLTTFVDVFLVLIVFPFDQTFIKKCRVEVITGNQDLGFMLRLLPSPSGYSAPARLEINYWRGEGGGLDQNRQS